MKQNRRNITVVLATACAAVLATTTASYAEVTVVRDGADAPSLTDIRKVRVDHGDEQLKVRVHFPDLRKKAEAGLNVYIDRNAQRRGPEFGLATPLFSGSDYALLRMNRWQFTGNRVECDYDVKLKWQQDMLVFSADRGCFGNPDELRVGMRMRDVADGSHPVTDWMIDRRAFTEWLSSGEAVSARRA